MYAIVQTGGKQIRVEEGRSIKVEKLPAEAGAEVVLDKVLLVEAGGAPKIGTPFVSGAKVTCQVVEHGRDKKIVVFKKKRRNDYKKKQGHRQEFTTLKITGISA
ncbi:MAG: 50S ribosomal protein L21 [Thermodesulfobacteriota bacterium]